MFQRKEILFVFLAALFSCSHQQLKPLLDSEALVSGPDAKKLKYLEINHSAISPDQFMILRDSEQKNAQNYCITQIKKEKNQSIELWSVAATEIRKIEGNYSFNCQAAYFENKEDLKTSVLARIEKSLDYVPLELQEISPNSALSQNRSSSRLISKVSRLAYPPFISVSIENIEPHENFSIGGFEKIVKIVSRKGPKGSSQNLEFEVNLEDDHGPLESPSGTASLQVNLYEDRSSQVLRYHPELILSLPSSDPGSKDEKKHFKLISPQSVLSFPNTFQWALASSAHQIEGGNEHNDWHDFERTPGKIFGNQTNHDGPDHWNQLEKDVALLKQMGVTQYRMSMEWSRLEPSQGKWKKSAARHYQREIKLLRQNGIEPIITLWHSTLPSWVSQKGGWEWDGIPNAFGQFASYVQREIAPDVVYWITLNEPLPYLLGAYVKGVVPPAKTGNLGNVEKPLVTMLKAHAEVYQRFHSLPSKGQKKNHRLQVGIAHRMDMFTPYEPGSILDRFASDHTQEVFNWAIPNAVKTGVLRISIPLVADIHVEIPGLANTQDFFGINYYTRYALRASLFPFDIKDHPIQGTQEITDMGWEIYPEGLYILLSQIQKDFPNMPISITENGIADSTDQLRKKYLHRHLVYLHYAIEKKIPVFNYCHWSLYDNFEWDQGYSIRVGLFEINYQSKSKERIPRKSAKFLKKIITRHGIRLHRAKDQSGDNQP